ncbi:MAG: hypothetical protein DMG70_10195 [Acidobacteria bacterium]|nr:MAG: hypothetical protein DMG70_10195 [Acidobacteriota bacterium]PYY08573.1 MAG: hypothetical protein DMG69_13740 [Acidobacteriota bacterium]
MQTTPVQKDFVDAIAAEMVTCVDKAVECWMAEFDSVLQDPRLTTLGRLQAIGAVVERYKHATGKSQLRKRSH